MQTFGLVSSNMYSSLVNYRMVFESCEGLGTLIIHWQYNFAFRGCS